MLYAYMICMDKWYPGSKVENVDPRLRFPLNYGNVFLIRGGGRSIHDEEMQSETVYGWGESEIAAMTEYKTSEIWCENNGQRIYGMLQIAR